MLTALPRRLDSVPCVFPVIHVQDVLPARLRPAQVPRCLSHPVHRPPGVRAVPRPAGRGDPHPGPGADRFAAQGGPGAEHGRHRHVRRPAHRRGTGRPPGAAPPDPGGTLHLRPGLHRPGGQRQPARAVADRHLPAGAVGRLLWRSRCHRAAGRHADPRRSRIHGAGRCPEHAQRAGGGHRRAAAGHPADRPAAWPGTTA